jgi:hypothetical protein
MAFLFSRPFPLRKKKYLAQRLESDQTNKPRQLVKIRHRASADLI